MATIHDIINDIGPYVCRECVNMEYGAKLLPSDCFYVPVRDRCSCCGQRKHILYALRFSGKLKLIGKKRKRL